MNIQNPHIDCADAEPAPTPAELEAAARLLLRWAGEEGANGDFDHARRAAARLASAPSYPTFHRGYPETLEVDAGYLATLPDLHNGPESLIRGARTPIQHVGISNFRLPVRYPTRDGSQVQLETSVTGSVSLEADRKGINMSRIMRSFYSHAERSFSFDVIDGILDAYLRDLDSTDARIQLRFSYPMLRHALRSRLEGWQYYNVALEMTKSGGATRRIIHLDYVYSSTCPCSLELAEHARRTRNQIATPHSQRSVARVSLECLGSETLWIEDVVDLCARAIPTETQVMAKREDEQAFAELNGANPIFVEDAVRLICESLGRDPRIGDFRVVASHQESLHSHDAVSILTRGGTFAQASHDPRLFDTLHHAG